MTAREMFRKAYNGHKNLMTPQVVYCKKLRPTVAVELSVGSAMNHEPIYGVTLVTMEGGTPTPDYDRSKMFSERAAAENYVKGLRTTLP